MRTYKKNQVQLYLEVQPIKQVLSREMMLDKVNAGPQRDRTAEGVSEPPAPGTETRFDGDQPLETLPVDATPTPCP